MQSKKSDESSESAKKHNRADDTHACANELEETSLEAQREACVPQSDEGEASSFLYGYDYHQQCAGAQLSGPLVGEIFRLAYLGWSLGRIAAHVNDIRGVTGQGG